MENSKKIGIIIADVDEFLPLKEKIVKGSYTVKQFLKREVLEFSKHGIDFIAILCGIGKVNAAAASVYLINEGCSAILNYGLSGGVAGVRRGDITVPDRFLEHDFDLSVIGYKPCEKPAQESYIYNTNKSVLSAVLNLLPNIKVGTAVTGDKFICDENTRSFLHNEFDAMSCDMETAAIAYVCEFSSLPFVAVRRISDDAGAEAADTYREMNTSGETVLSDFIIECAKAIATVI